MVERVEEPRGKWVRSGVVVALKAEGDGGGRRGELEAGTHSGITTDSGSGTRLRHSLHL